MRYLCIRCMKKRGIDTYCRESCLRPFCDDCAVEDKCWSISEAELEGEDKTKAVLTSILEMKEREKRLEEELNGVRAELAAIAGLVASSGGTEK